MPNGFQDRRLQPLGHPSDPEKLPFLGDSRKNKTPPQS
jgi:hypothetical protein